MIVTFLQSLSQRAHLMENNFGYGNLLLHFLHLFGWEMDYKWSQIVPFDDLGKAENYSV